MKKETYLRLSEFIRSSGKREKIVQWLNRWITRLVSVLYVGLLVMLAVRSDSRIWRAIAVPGLGVLIVTVMRKWIGARRPYEIWQIRPLIEKDTVRKSFPSRHVFSVYVIGMLGVWIQPEVGVILFLLGIGLAGIRVISGVHFIRDVLAGAAFGISCGWIGFYLI